MRRTAFDLVVIGSGVAGSTVAQRCREAGWSVAVVDSRPFGGTCALRGCEPKKVLYEVTEAAERARRLGDKGLRPVGLAIDWPALARFKRTFTDPVTPARERAFSEAGIAVIHGRARFVRPTALRVGEDELDARHVVVAAGARPAELPLEGHEHLAPSDTFLELEQLPARLVFVGGGYVSFELAHVAVRAGAQVTLLHRSRRPLAGFDPDLVARLVEHSRQLGIDVVLEAEAQAIRPAADGYAVLARTPAGTRTVAADLVVHGAGRVPDIDDLDCAVGGVERDRRGVVVDDHLQSVSNPVVYAAGDAASAGPQLTPVALHHGAVVAANLLGGNPERVGRTPVASVVFTGPPLAAVGQLEEQARAAGLRFKARLVDTSGFAATRRVGAQVAAAKILIEERSGRILGAHLLGPDAAELINVLTLALRAKVPAPALAETLFAYPTAASDLRYLLA